MTTMIPQEISSCHNQPLDGCLLNWQKISLKFQSFTPLVLISYLHYKNCPSPKQHDLVQAINKPQSPISPKPTRPDPHHKTGTRHPIFTRVKIPTTRSTLSKYIKQFPVYPPNSTRLLHPSTLNYP